MSRRTGRMHANKRWQRSRSNSKGGVGSWISSLFLVGGIASILFAIAVVAQHGLPTATASGPGSWHAPQQPSSKQSNYQLTCGMPSLPACPQNQTQWIPLKSQAPGDIIAAARTSPMLAMPTGDNQAGNGDYLHDLSHLDTPVLIRAIAGVHAAAPDYYDVPVLNASHQIVGVILLELNPSHTAISVTDIVTYPSPHPAGALSRLTEQQAVQSVQTHVHVGLRSGASPYLVYFPPDYQAEETGKLTWVSGGQSPYDPIWLVPGADNHDHVVGTDGQVYDVSQLPFASQG